jgi:hypothetical protein
MSTQNPPDRVGLRRKTLKDSGTLFIFLVIAVLVETVVVLYAMAIGIKDPAPLQWSFTFPGTGSNVTLVVSPLFHLVPIAVIISLVSSWAYLRRQMITKSGEAQRGKPSTVSKSVKGQEKTFVGRIRSAFSRKERSPSFGSKVRFRRSNLRSALIVLVVFSALLLLISLFAYPRLLYQAVGSLYENNSALIAFVKDVGAAFAPIGVVFSPITGALVAAAPGFRSFVLALGLLVAPLATLDDAAKYLIFQNGAAWISTFIVLLYGNYARKTSRQMRK